MELKEQLVSLLGKPVSDASDEELYRTLVLIAKERINARPLTDGNKKLYYISAEFLTGRQLGKNLINLGIYKEISSILNENGKSITAVEDCEPEPSLGNGGLGRLAACFLDSISTLNLNGDGVGLRYHFGLFKQEFRDHRQYEVPDRWLTEDGWVTRTDVSFPVTFGDRTVQSIMYDLDVVGFDKGHTKLHLFDIDTLDESLVGEGISFE